MSTLVSFDPGLRVAGVAFFSDGKLRWATLARSDEPKVRGPMAWLAMGRAVSASLVDHPGPYDKVVVEVPQVYPGAPIDPANLIELAGVNGAVIARLEATEHRGYLPRLWKGNKLKEKMLAHIEACLSVDEAKCIDFLPASLRHNAIDAIGIGLYELGRL